MRCIPRLFYVAICADGRADRGCIPIGIVYITRHGETDWNHAGRIQGHTDVPLNDLGRAQGEALARRLVEFNFDVIYSSDLRRARETAEMVAKQQRQPVPLIETPELREICYGAWEGLTVAQVRERYAEDLASWSQGARLGNPTEGESFTRVMGRAGRVCKEAAKKEMALIVTHGGALHAILCHVLGIPPHLRARFMTGNCALTAIDWPAGRDPCLVLLNDSCHLRDIEVSSPTIL